MKKVYVLDTNVLLADPDAIFSFEENDVIIPMVALEELDSKKTRSDEVGKIARQVNRTLDNLRKEGNGLEKGVKIRSGGTLRVSKMNKSETLPVELDGTKVDNMIILHMLYLKKQDIDAKLVTKDISVRIKCDSLGIVSEDYLRERVISEEQEFYSGVKVIEATPNQVQKLYRNKEVELDDEDLEGSELYPNEIVVLRGPDPAEGQTRVSAITRFPGYKDNGNHMPLIPVGNYKQVHGLSPRNKEQNFSLDLLMNPDIKLVTLLGPAGTGKTLIALAAALAQHSHLGDSDELKRYQRLIVSRPVQTVGKEIGFLPGDLEEKMAPWVAPIRDNLEFLMGSGKKKNRRRNKNSEGSFSSEPYLSLLQEKGLIEIEAIAFIRGRSIPESFIVIDEAQNLSVHELKTIITRVGENTKIVLTGDIEQIDNDKVDVYNNGLTYAVEKFKNHPIAGHVTLVKGERSQLATLASQIL